MTIFTGTFLDTPQDPFAGGSLRARRTARCWSATA